MVASKKQVLLSLLITMLGQLIAMVGQVESAGAGNDALWAEDTGLDVWVGESEPKDTMFFHESKDEKAEQLKRDFTEAIRGVRIELVAPNSQLMKMMNIVATKTRALFLEQHKHYFETHNIGSTSRPMLYAYLGLHFATEEQLISWYAPNKRRIQRQLLDSCKSLIKTRKESAGDRLNTKLISKAKKKIDHEFHLGYLVFKNNLNLFMLDNYLLLCKKLEPKELEESLESIVLIV